MAVYFNRPNNRRTIEERYAGDGVMVVFNEPAPVENPALQGVLMALELRHAIRALTATIRILAAHAQNDRVVEVTEYVRR
jgi:class 3 adenylate cyclase